MIGDQYLALLKALNTDENPHTVFEAIEKKRASGT